MLKKNLLGRTGIAVTELCFGVLPMGPLQANIPAATGAKVIRAGLEAGINFFDTAELYNTYEHIRQALIGWDEPVVLVSKSTAASYQDMAASIDKALKELDRPYIDVFLMHAARETPEVFTKRAGALQCLVDYKAQGLIKATGIASHDVTTIRAAAEQPDIDVAFALINKIGRGILNGSKEAMIEAMMACEKAGKGVYAMKALAGGNLLDDYLDALDYVQKIPGLAATAIGIIEPEELAMNLAYFEGQELEPSALKGLKNQKKLQAVEMLCVGCGKCVAACPNFAIELVSGPKGIKAKVDTQKCLLCGYCSPYCSEFALRMC